MAGITYDRIEHDGIQWPCPAKDHPGTSTLFLDKFNTQNGKALLNPVDHVEQSEQPTHEHPFLLNSGRILYHYHTATMSRRNKALTAFVNESYVLMHPFDVEKKGLKEGDKVRLSNDRGELETFLRSSEEVVEGELFMPWHFYEAPVNKLTRAELDPYSKIAPFKLSACKVEKV
jgi:predicted molibdopterin-dependent oxidoreductase YjgC